MHKLSIGLHFISSTALIYKMHWICKAKKDDFGILRGRHGSFGLPKSVYAFKQYENRPIAAASYNKGIGLVTVKLRA